MSLFTLLTLPCQHAWNYRHGTGCRAILSVGILLSPTAAPIARPPSPILPSRPTSARQIRARSEDHLARLWPTKQPNRASPAWCDFKDLASGQGNLTAPGAENGEAVARIRFHSLDPEFNSSASVATAVHYEMPLVRCKSERHNSSGRRSLTTLRMLRVARSGRTRKRRPAQARLGAISHRKTRPLVAVLLRSMLPISIP